MPAVVQHRSTFGNNVTSIGLAFLSNNAAGNLLTYFSGAASSGTLNIATDSNTNTIANAALIDAGSPNGSVRADYVANSHSGANTVTAHNSLSVDLHIHIWEVSGCVTTTPVRASGTVGNSATASVSTSTTTPLSGDAVLAFFYDNPANDALVAGTGYSPSDLSANGTGGDAGISEYKSATAGGTQTATCTGNSTHGLTQIIVVFIQAAGGGPTTDQLSPNWYTDGETASSARSQYTLGTVNFHHEIFVADGFDPGKPILPVSATSGIWYNEHLDSPNIQGPQHKMQDVDLERWTQRIILPAQPSWDNDAENQSAQAGNQGLGSDQGLDWTQFIVIPGLDASVSRVDIDDFSNQFPNPGWAAILAEYETWTQNVLIPTVSWDTDTDNQVQQDGYHVNDANLDWTEFVVLQVLPFDPSTSFVDSDVDYQGPQAGYSGLGSDSGQDWVQYILIPAPAWDGDLDHANVNPTLAQGPYFFNDETVGVPIVFIPANGGPAFTLYIPLHQLSALHGLSQL